MTYTVNRQTFKFVVLLKILEISVRFTMCVCSKWGDTRTVARSVTLMFAVLGTRLTPVYLGTGLRMSYHTVRYSRYSFFSSPPPTHPQTLLQVRDCYNLDSEPLTYILIRLPRTVVLPKVRLCRVRVSPKFP